MGDDIHVSACNFDLCAECCGSCGTFISTFGSAFSEVGLGEIFGRSYPQHKARFVYQALLIMQIIVLFLISVLSFPVTLLWLMFFVGLTFEFAAGLGCYITCGGCCSTIVMYIQSHLQWFSVTQKDGCCCFMAVCVETRHVMILNAIGHMALALQSIPATLNAFNPGFFGFFGILLFPFYVALVVINIYMIFAVVHSHNALQAAGPRKRGGPLVGSPVQVEMQGHGRAPPPVMAAPAPAPFQPSGPPQLPPPATAPLPPPAPMAGGSAGSLGGVKAVKAKAKQWGAPKNAAR